MSTQPDDIPFRSHVSYPEFNDFRQETRREIERLRIDQEREFRELREDMAAGIKALGGEVRALVDTHRKNEEDNTARRWQLLVAIAGSVILGLMEASVTVFVVLHNWPA
jgi:hypothetical protein